MRRPCFVCGGDPENGCNCGVWGISYEVTGGAHESWCIYYHGCHHCGGSAKEPWRWILLDLVPVWWWEWRDKRREVRLRRVKYHDHFGTHYDEDDCREVLVEVIDDEWGDPDGES